MATYTIPITTERIAALGDDGAQAVTERLTAQGITVDGVSLRTQPTPAIVIEADRDPAADLDGWSPPPSRDALARATLRQGIGAIRSGQSDTLTPAQWRERVEDILVALSWLALRVGEDQ